MNSTSELSLRIVLMCVFIILVLWTTGAEDFVPHNDLACRLWAAFVISLIAGVVLAMLTLIWSCC